MTWNADWQRRELRGSGVWLGDSVVQRGPRSTGYLSYETGDVLVRASNAEGAAVAVANSAVAIRFLIASKGGGDTVVVPKIGSKDFRTLIQAMFVSNREATVQALSNELPQWGLKLESNREDVAA
jgi:hypothetical protein